MMWVQEADAGATLKTVIAMSQMTSMLHDADRNSKYHRAITSASPVGIR